MSVLATSRAFRGRLIWLLPAVSLALATHSQAQTSDGRANRLVNGWIEAAGGRNVWDRVRTLQYTITTVWYDSAGNEVRRRPRYVWIRKLPGAFQVRVERTEAAGEYVQALDSDKAWATLDGVLLPDTARAVREVPYVAGDLVYWMGLPWKLNDPGVRLAYVEPNVVRVGFDDGVGLHDGDRYWYYWESPDARFPTHVEYIEQGKTENDRERVVWSGWTRLGPAVYAVKRQLVHPATGRLLRAFIVSDVKVNGRLHDSLFHRP